MTDDDDELCPVCESTCTCNHQLRDRGSARANGYRPKTVTTLPTRGKESYIPQSHKPQSSSSSPALVPAIPLPPAEPSSAGPIRIRLKLGKNASTTVAAPQQIQPSENSSLRRKRSVAYTSSSESSVASSSKGKARVRPQLSSSSSASRLRSHSPGSMIRGSPSTIYPASVDAHLHEGSSRNASGPTSSRTIPHSSTSRPGAPKTSAAVLKSSRSRPTSVTPSAAWFLGAPPPRSSSLKANFKKLSSGHAPHRSNVSSDRVASSSSLVTTYPKSAGALNKKHIPPACAAREVTLCKPANSGVSKPRKGHSARPPNATISRIGKGGKPDPLATVPRASSGSALKKRRRITYTPSPSPPARFGHDSSSDSTSLSEDGEYREADFVPSARHHHKRKVQHTSHGNRVVLGRPVGTVLPTFLPKDDVSSSALDSDEESSDDSDKLDAQDLDGFDEIREEEERMILKEERRKERARRKKEGSSKNTRQGPQQNHRPDAEAFMSSDLTSLSSSSSNTSESSASSSASTDIEDDESDDDDDDEADGYQGDAQHVDAGTWSDSDESEMDADLFFANLISDGEELEDDDQSSKASADEGARPASGGTVQVVGVEAGGPTSYKINNGEFFVDADTFENLHRRRLFRPLVSSRGRGVGGGHRQSRPPSRKHSPNHEQPLIITEDPDGQLVFADAWGVEARVVNSEWEKAQVAVVMNDEDVTSEESASEDGLMSGIEGEQALVEGQGENATESETETDFDGESTVDEGLDEDGLPPAMASQSQQHRSEREFNLRRLRLQQEAELPLPNPDHLPPGIELFHGGYATVLFGRYDFPAVEPLEQPNSVPGPSLAAPISDSFSESPDWESIMDEEDSRGRTVHPKDEPLDIAPPVAVGHDGDSFALTHKEIVASPELNRALLEPLAGLSQEAFGSPAGVEQDQMDLDAAVVPMEAPPLHGSTSPPPHADATDLQTVSPEPQDDYLPTPPRKLPAMGFFTFSPPPPTTPIAILPSETVLQDAANLPSNTMLPSPSTSTKPGESEERATTPKPGPTKGMAIIDGRSTVTIPSPFANVKRRKKPAKSAAEESEGSLSGRRSDGQYNQWAAGRNAQRSVPNSARSSFSQAFPSLDTGFKRPVLGTDTVPPTPDVFGHDPFTITTSMDLTDVVDSAFLDEDDAGAVGLTTGDEEDASEKSALRNLCRWDRVPMGTFRQARAFGIGHGEPVVHGHHRQGSHVRRLSDGFSYGADPRPAPSFSSTLLSDAANTDLGAKAGKREKAKSLDITSNWSSRGAKSSRRRNLKLVVSPILFPATIPETPNAEMEEEPDVGLMTGVEEEEGYFSRRLQKGGREGTEREKVKRKYEEKEKKYLSNRSPALKKAKHATGVASEEMAPAVNLSETSQKV
ncbi:hypothetical protein FRB99_003557 [Tulasnella sp. 403]|nr:hypothetical protein FRB99_003557 [Tulasnella sp. 403]